MSRWSEDERSSNNNSSRKQSGIEPFQEASSADVGQLCLEFHCPLTFFSLLFQLLLSYSDLKLAPHSLLVLRITDLTSHDG